MSTIKVDAIKNSSGQSEISVTTLKADTIQNTSGASVIKVDTLQTTTSQDIGMCRMFCNWSNVGTPSIRRGMNVSSLTDVTTNTTEVNMTNAMADTSYSITAAHQSGTRTTWNNTHSAQFVIMTSSKIREIWYSTDSNMLYVAIFS